MASATRPESPRPLFVERGLALASRVVDGIGDLGFGAFAWPPLIGIGLGVGVLMLREPRFAAGILKHRSTLEFSKPALTGILFSTIAAVLVAIAGGLGLRRRGRVPSLGEGFVVATRRLAVLAALPLALAMGQPLEPSRDWLALAFVFAIAAVATYSLSGFLRDDAGAVGRTARVAPAVVVGVSMAAFVGRLSTLAIAHHVALGTGRPDVGAAISVLRETGQGRLLQCSLCAAGSPVPRHFEPIALLLAPFFRLSPRAETLFVFQALALAAGAPAVFLLGRRATESAWAGAALALAYLLHPGVHGAMLSGYHSLALATPLLLWTFWFLETGAQRRYLVFLVLALATREDVVLAVVGLALYALSSGSRDRVRLGLVSLAVAAAWVVLLFVLRQPAPTNTLVASLDTPPPLDPKKPVKARGTYALRGGPFWSLLVALSVPKMDYAAKVLTPLLGLPLLARGRILLGYGAALALFSSLPDYATFGAAETSLLVPFVFALGAAALARLRTEELAGWVPGSVRRAFPAGVVVASTLCSMKFGATAANASFRAGPRALVRVATPEQRRAAAWLEDVFAKLPQGSRVAVSAHLAPHAGRVSTMLALEDRGRADFVAFQTRLRLASKVLGDEEAKGQLVRYASRGDLRVVRTRYRGALPSTKPIDDE